MDTPCRRLSYQALSFIHYQLYIANYTLYIINYTLPIIHCQLYIKKLMRSRLYIIHFTLYIFAVIAMTVIASCSSDTEDYNAYENWEARNKAWYEQIADSARTAIQSARAQYGSNWEQHCDWRMLKSLQRSQTKQSDHQHNSHKPEEKVLAPADVPQQFAQSFTCVFGLFCIYQTASPKPTTATTLPQRQHPS